MKQICKIFLIFMLFLGASSNYGFGYDMKGIPTREMNESDKESIESCEFLGELLCDKNHPKEVPPEMLLGSWYELSTVPTNMLIKKIYINESQSIDDSLSETKYVNPKKCLNFITNEGGQMFCHGKIVENDNIVKDELDGQIEIITNGKDFPDMKLTKHFALFNTSNNIFYIIGFVSDNVILVWEKDLNNITDTDKVRFSGTYIKAPHNTIKIEQSTKVNLVTPLEKFTVEKNTIEKRIE